jgi:hypothetical protein
MLGGRRLPPRILSKSLAGPGGEPAIMIEALPIVAGQQVLLRFDSAHSGWRQGVFMATAGMLATADTRSSQLILWNDTAPAETSIAVVETDGRLVLYNVWDSGRGRGRFESQSHTSGMIVEERPDGWLRYSCTDIGVEPDFGRLVFRVSIR